MGPKISKFASYLFEAGSAKDACNEEAVVSNLNHLRMHCCLLLPVQRFGCFLHDLDYAEDWSKDRPEAEVEPALALVSMPSSLHIHFSNLVVFWGGDESL